VAIRAREEQGDNATFHFIDNQSLAIEFAGKIIIDLAPHVYDTARMVNIITPTNEQQAVLINQTFIDPDSGEEKEYNFTEGKFSVAVRVGPSFESKRQEMAQSIVEMSQAYPPLMELAGDLAVQAMDWPQSEEIAERIKAKMAQAQNPPPDPAMQAAQAAMQVEGVKAQGAMQKAQADMQIKQVDLQIKQIELAIKQQEAQSKGVEAQVRVYEAQQRAMHPMPDGSMMPGAQHPM
jgi:hypothetical protein